MLTKTAFEALVRLSFGKPMFGRAIDERDCSGSQKRLIELARREAVRDLIARRYVRRTKNGPKITSTGVRYLDDCRSIVSAKIDAVSTAERYGVSVRTAKERAVEVRRIIRRMATHA